MSGYFLPWCMLVLSAKCCLDSFQAHRTGEELGQNLLGYLIIVCHDGCSCATGGGSRGGGFLDPSVPRSPGASPQESRAAHGPRHPAVTIPPRLCLNGDRSLVRCFRDICLVFCVWIS